MRCRHERRDSRDPTIRLIPRSRPIRSPSSTTSSATSSSPMSAKLLPTFVGRWPWVSRKPCSAWSALARATSTEPTSTMTEARSPPLPDARALERAARDPGVARRPRGPARPSGALHEFARVPTRRTPAGSGRRRQAGRPVDRLEGRGRLDGSARRGLVAHVIQRFAERHPESTWSRARRGPSCSDAIHSRRSATDRPDEPIQFIA